MLNVLKLDKRYSDSHKESAVLTDISFRLEPGKILGVVGPSGTGKTTLLRCIAGLELPDGGSVVLGNTVLCDVSKKLNVPTDRRSIGYLSQTYPLWPHMSVLGNVAFPLKVERKSLSSRSIVARANEAIEAVGISHLASRWPQSLSGGQRQRVALARALVRRPRILLLDEPLNGVDETVREALQRHIILCTRSWEMLTIFVTHNIADAMSKADDVLVMNGGRLVQCGSPSELYHRPVNHWVATYLGLGSVVRCNVDSVNGRGANLRLLGTDQRFEISGGVHSMGEVDVLFRTTSCSLRRSSAGNDGFFLSGIFEGADYCGVGWNLRVSIGEVLLRVASTVSTPCPPGTRIEVWVDAKSLVIM